MTEQPSARPAAPPRRGMPGRILGMPAPVALGLAAAIAAGGYLLWRRRSQASSASPGQPLAAPGTDLSGNICTDAFGNPGLTDALGNCVASTSLQQATGTEGTGGGTATGTAPPPPAPSTPAGTATVPDVKGMQVNTAIARLKTAGLGYHLSETRNPAYTYTVFSQTPGPGAKVAKGSTVDLGIRSTHLGGAR